jgi:hypothetical protein
MAKAQRERALILVKAFPQPSQKYEETVCVAGLTPEGRFVRLYPIRYRHLPVEKRFDRWDVIEYEAERPHKDHRPESRHVNEDTLEIVQHRDQWTAEERVAMWAPHVSASLIELRAQNLSDQRTLGVVKPDPGSVRLKFTRLSATEAKARQEEFKQVSLLDSNSLPALPVDYEFRYLFTSGGHPHDMKIHDWEIQAAYLQYGRRYGDQALEFMTQEYQQNIPVRNLHLVMGTMQAHPRQFIIIGLLRSTVSPVDAQRQGKLL